MQFWQILGDLHPKLVQFPLVLLLAGLVFDAAGLTLRSPRLHFAAKLLKIGVVNHDRYAVRAARSFPAGIAMTKLSVKVSLDGEAYGTARASPR